MALSYADVCKKAESASRWRVSSKSEPWWNFISSTT
jgi:hypothetical protein